MGGGCNTWSITLSLLLSRVKRWIVQKNVITLLEANMSKRLMFLECREDGKPIVCVQVVILFC